MFKTNLKLLLQVGSQSEPDSLLVKIANPDPIGLSYPLEISNTQTHASAKISALNDAFHRFLPLAEVIVPTIPAETSILKPLVEVSSHLIKLLDVTMG